MRSWAVCGLASILPLSRFRATPPVVSWMPSTVMKRTFRSIRLMYWMRPSMSAETVVWYSIDL